jgi:two-component sensor histidine kinase
VLLRESTTASSGSLQIIASLLHLQANSSNREDVEAALTNAWGGRRRGAGAPPALHHLI